ncbi:type I CRISPR-associated protein Cas7 [Bacillus cereus]|uniref:type I CRISPR-associated protein Cas7 n=1 Tax=Bacillus cereus TaxID=1396 RepID=UPI0018F3D3A2|nr:type I CRISPR-associated protein Cas7 [Bacillus cereus]MBJ7967838.1 type I CRISPR-associated protein Cas7 [Bacillus cereus]MBJ8004215.1 type I CRISPR-associated protein Cas7 [Bacillus cereus]
MNEWKKRVYGIIGVSTIMSNWNADFTGRPKSLSDGIVFGSDKALKFSMKKYWVNQGEKVLYIKSYKITPKEGRMQPKELIERYQEIFDTEISKKSKTVDVLKNLFLSIDVMNFGATFAVEGQNIGLTGVVQIGQGMNKYEDTTTEVQDILSPFRNSNKEYADASSLGTKIVSNEAHCFYPFSVNPNNYDVYSTFIDDFDGYTEEAYMKFKKASLIGATALNTNSKSGCYNNFALFIECKEEAPLYLPPLDSYIEFNKQEDLYSIDMKKIEELLKPFQNKLENIEIFYNPLNTSIITTTDMFVRKNIFTEEKLEVLSV